MRTRSSLGLFTTQYRDRNSNDVGGDLMALTCILSRTSSTKIISSGHRIPSAFFSSLCKESTFALPDQLPPSPKKVPFRVSAHGRTWDDPFHWMSDKKDPDFSNYLHEENSYAESFMADTADVRGKLLAEMKSRMPAGVTTPPERWGPWLYYQYIPEGKEFPVLCRKPGGDKSSLMTSVANYLRRGMRSEQILLDWNKIAEEYGYVHVGTCRVSPDHRYLAYTVDVTGSELFKLQVKALETGHVLARFQVEGVVSLAWALNSSTLFYTMVDDSQRPYRVVSQDLFQDNLGGDVVYTETDSEFSVDITATKDGKFITVNSNSRTSSEEEVYVIDAINPLKGLRRIFKRLLGVQFFLEHFDGSFYVLTNAPMSRGIDWNGEGYYLGRCQVDDIHSSQFQNIVLPGEDITFQDMDVFNGYLVLSVNKKGVPALCSIDLPVSIKHQHLIELENLNPWFFPVCANTWSIVPGSNHDFMTPIYRTVLSSPVMPDVIVDYDLTKKTFSIVHQEEVNCENHIKTKNTEIISDSEMQRWEDFSEIYYCEKKEVTSYDGVEIPLTILYSKAALQQGRSPGLLHGYGAYGEVLDISWCPDRLSLLDRGWVVAFADVRGGGGTESSWHKSGNGFFKENSIHDFASCGNYLINEGFVHEDRLCAIGQSAGCILAGGVINKYPSLFRGAILKVPFLDICNTLLDPSLPLTTTDYEEFGNPQIPSQFETIKRYSPYDNVPQGVCPPSTLVTASFLDSRVGVWEAAKWVAKVRDNGCSVCSRSVILRTDMNAGHFSEGGYFQHLEDTAYDYAFLMKVVGF